MKRRTFLTLAGIGTSLAAFASVRFLTSPFENTAADCIRRELSFLKLDEEGLLKFANAYGKDKDKKFKLMIKGYSLFRIDSEQSGKIHNMVSNYLLSTDFFQNGMDETRVIKYVGMYDPYTRPCSHPFSHIHFA